MSAAEIRSRLINGAAVIYPGLHLNQLRGERIESQCQEFLATVVRRIVIIEMVGTEEIALRRLCGEFVQAGHSSKHV